MIRLLVKTYSNGKKYLCKRQSDDYITYLGSGNKVTKDLVLVDTEVLFETNDPAKFKEIGIYYSELWNVDTNPLFLNMKYEEGDGGDTLSGKKVYNNGKVNKYFYEGTAPAGWNKGRWDKHNFSSKIQKEKFAKATHTSEKQIAATRRMGLANKGKTPWLGKTHSEETKKLQSKKASNREKKTCPHCSRDFTPQMFSMWHGDKCKDKKS